MTDLNSGELIGVGSSENGNRKRKLSGDGDGGDLKMTKKTDNTARDKVFGNPLLMDRIIGYAMPLDRTMLSYSKRRGSKDWEKLRLVNKTFNQAVLRSFRKEFRDISIRMTCGGKVTLNRCWMRRRRFGGFGNFLKNVAKVEFHAIRVNRVDKHYMSEIVPRLMNMVEDNYEKLKVFTGLDLLRSRDQEKCAEIAVRCREYGPLQLNVLLDAFCEKTHHYDTLIVSEYLLENIAMQCAESAVDKDDCLARMAAIITPNITCRRLVLKLYEKPKGDPKGYFDAWYESHYISTQSLPREIIDEMVRKWNVKSVKLEFHSNTIEPIVSSSWTKFEYFTEVRFDQLYVNVRLSNYRLDLVEVDLENASLILMAIADEQYRSRRNEKSYENLFANVRRVFPTNVMNVKFSMTSHSRRMRPGRMTEMIQNIMNLVWIDDPTNLKMKIDMFSYLDPAFNSHQIPSHFYNNHLDVRMTVADCLVEQFGEWNRFGEFELRSARGKRYRVVDEMNNCQIDFGVFERMITVTVVDKRRGKMIFECHPSDTFDDLKKIVAARLCRSPDKLTLSACGKLFFPNWTLLKHKIRNELTLYTDWK